MNFKPPRHAVEAVVHWYDKEGATLSDVAKYLQCSVNTAREVLKGAGVRIRRSGRREGSGKPPTDRVMSYIEDYRSGIKVAEIARRHSVSRQAVHSALKYRGILEEKADEREEGVHGG